MKTKFAKLLGKNAAFRLFSADIDLGKNPHREPSLLSLTLELLGKRDRFKRMDERELIDYPLYLVSLQMSDEVDFNFIFHTLVMLDEGIGSVFADRGKSAMQAESIELIRGRIFRGNEKPHTGSSAFLLGFADTFKRGIVTRKKLRIIFIFTHISQVPFRGIDPYPSE